LVAAGATVIAHDPAALENLAAELGDTVECAENMYDAVKGADALAGCTEWHDYQTPDFERIREHMRQAVIFDGRNIWRP
jgi:UDPglucose 6-dehydrogenase